MAPAQPETYQAEVCDGCLIGQLLLLQLYIQGTLLFPHLPFLVPVILLGPPQGQDSLCLQLCQVLLLLVQQVLHLLLVHLKTGQRLGEGLSRRHLELGCW